MSDSQIEIVGGARFPSRLNRFWSPGISWPLARLSCDEYGIAIKPRSFVLNAATRPFWPDWIGGALAGWQTPWEELDGIASSRLSILFTMRDPEVPGCRFFAMRPQPLREVVEQAALNRVPVRRVRTTLGWYFGR
jgi:hypothetical protein